MSLNAALQIGRSALATSQAAMQVTGDNMANAATPGYHRRSTHLAPVQGQMIAQGQFIGQGVRLLAVRREIDLALQARHRDAISHEQGAMINQRFLSSLETIQNELTDNDLSSLMSAFFNSFSELANNPEDQAVRSVAIQQGQTLADRVAAIRSDYVGIVREIDRTLGEHINDANDVLDRIADLNQRIATTEAGQGSADSLRDERDRLVDQLAERLDVTVVERPNGMTDILVDSIPILLGSESRGLELRTVTGGDTAEVSLRVAADGTKIQARSGSIGALLTQREETVDPLLEGLDDFASELIFQVNRLHSQGQGKHGYSSLNGAYQLDDTSAAFGLPESGTPFTISNGSFFIHVTHQDTGIRTTHEISVDPTMMSLDDLVSEINTVVGVPNVTASVSPERTLQIDADAGFEFTFSDDTSGALAALGMNVFFTGTDAASIAVNEELAADPGLLAAGEGHVLGSNGTALAIAGLQDQPLDDLGGRTLREHWQNQMGGLAVKAGAANDAVASTRLVRESLAAQVQSTSGVSLDEESINLLSFQRQYQAAARFIGVIDETLQTLISIA